MNEKTNTTPAITLGTPVRIISNDGTKHQEGTLGMTGIVRKLYDDGLTDVELNDGRKVTYLRHRLERVDVSAQPIQHGAEPVSGVSVAELIDSGFLVEMVVVDGDFFNFEPKADNSNKHPLGTQVMITEVVWDGPEPSPAGLFGMITKHGPMYGARDSNAVYDYKVHTTDGRDIYVNEGDINPVVSASQVDPSHPFALMERLGSLRALEKQMMSNLSQIRSMQQVSEIRATSLRACGDQVRNDRKAIIKQCEELEFELTRSIAAAA